MQNIDTMITHMNTLKAKVIADKQILIGVYKAWEDVIDDGDLFHVETDHVDIGHYRIGIDEYETIENRLAETLHCVIQKYQTAIDRINKVKEAKK